MNYPALLSFVCGFASLSLEILWVRLYGFAHSSTPAAFGFVLAAYLVGIAFGARVGARSCKRAASDAQLWQGSILAMLLSALLCLVLPWLFSRAFVVSEPRPLLDLLIIAAASGVLSYAFPIAHHLGTRDSAKEQGQRFARVYTANVAGAALGPLVTGYVLLDTISLQDCFTVLAAMQALAAILLVLALPVPMPAARGWLVAGGAMLACASGVATIALDPHHLVKGFGREDMPVKAVVENRHGIITVREGNAGDDLVYGGNVYDGRTNVNPERDTNGLQRPLLMAALHPAPKRVLMVGLSVGTWLALVREFPGVESIDVVEINPGYIEAARPYPAQAAALKDKRVHLVIDDARRWLRHHPDRRYDMVIMNTTLHWRSNASLLLSTELLQLIRAHMAPGAVMSFNATGSADAFYTATRVFPHAYRYMNFVYAADFDFRPRKDAAGARALYERLRLGPQPLFAPNSRAIDEIVRTPFVTLEADQKNMPGRLLEEVTDDNMITEFKYGRALFYSTDFLPF